MGRFFLLDLLRTLAKSPLLELVGILQGIVSRMTEKTSALLRMYFAIGRRQPHLFVTAIAVFWLCVLPTTPYYVARVAQILNL